jgi:hypothetical protein
LGPAIAPTLAAVTTVLIARPRRRSGVRGGVAGQHDGGVAATQHEAAGQQQRPASPCRRGHHQRGADGTGQVGGGQPGAPPAVAHDPGGRHRAHP